MLLANVQQAIDTRHKNTAAPCRLRCGEDVFVPEGVVDGVAVKPVQHSAGRTRIDVEGVAIFTSDIVQSVFDELWLVLCVPTRWARHLHKLSPPRQHPANVYQCRYFLCGAKLFRADIVFRQCFQAISLGVKVLVFLWLRGVLQARPAPSFLCRAPARLAHSASQPNALNYARAH